MSCDDRLHAFARRRAARRRRPARGGPALRVAAALLALAANGCRAPAAGDRNAAGPRPPAAVTAQPASPIPAELAARLEPFDAPATVASVIDGDTLRVALADGRRETVRLIGLNAPETGDGRRAVQCFGREATARLRELADGREVWLAADPTQDTRDRYGRLLAYGWLADGTLLNRAMIDEGFANEATYDRPYTLRDTFRAAAAAARRAERGLWSPSTCAGDYGAPPLP